MKRKVNHSSITVRNLEESLRFYETYFGMKKEKEFVVTVDAEGTLKGVTFRAVYLNAESSAFELIEYVNKKPGKQNELNSWDAGAAHIAINFSGIQEFYEKYKDEIRFLSAPIRSVDKGLDTTWLYLKDPNGMIIELSEDHLGAR
jgi:catechol 2,3-dioxygenase-like lactoylglutathione lyase family enzyme